MFQPSETESSAAGRSRVSQAAWIVLAAYAVIAAGTVLDYGVSWDEAIQSAYGEMVLDYFASGFEDRTFESFLNLRYYGPFFEVLPALVYRQAPYWKYETRHLLIALFAAAGLGATIAIARRLFPTGFGSLFAALALLGMPAFYGHTFFNSKDIPFAALFAWSMYALIRFAERPGWKSAGALGIVGGLAMAIRVGGVVIYVVAAIALITHAVAGRRGVPETVRALGRLIGAGALAWAVMVVLWPWAHRSPVARPLEALRSAVAFASKIEVRFAGATLMNDELPRTYLAHMFAVTTPLPTLTLIGAGCVLLAIRLLRRELTFPWIAVAAWAVVPALIQFLARSPVYDGTRHFLFIYPALALIAAAAGAALAGRMQHWIAVVAVCVVLLSALPAMVRLHPYQYVYYNELAGGVAGAAGDYDTDYWATTYREASLWIANHGCTERPASVLIAGDEFNAPAATWFLPPDTVVRTVFVHGIPGALPPQIDYYVATRRQQMHLNFQESPVAYSIDRMGATLAVVRGRCRDLAQSRDLMHNQH